MASYVLLAPLFLGVIVTEKELQIKNLMIIMGTKISAYWLGNFLFDLTLIIISYIVITITMFSSSFSIYTSFLLFIFINKLNLL